jgi:hypothetical protein
MKTDPKTTPLFFQTKQQKRPLFFNKIDGKTRHLNNKNMTSCHVLCAHARPGARVRGRAAARPTARRRRAASLKLNMPSLSCLASND